MEQRVHLIQVAPADLLAPAGRERNVCICGICGYKRPGKDTARGRAGAQQAAACRRGQRRGEQCTCMRKLLHGSVGRRQRGPHHTRCRPVLGVRCAPHAARDTRAAHRTHAHARTAHGTHAHRPHARTLSLNKTTHPLERASIMDGVSSCTAWRRLVRSPTSPRNASDSSSMPMPSTCGGAGCARVRVCVAWVRHTAVRAPPLVAHGQGRSPPVPPAPPRGPTARPTPPPHATPAAVARARTVHGS